jgi:hypothetical protein
VTGAGSSCAIPSVIARPRSGRGRHRATAQRSWAVIARPRSGRGPSSRARAAVVGRHRATAKRPCRQRETAKRPCRHRRGHKAPAAVIARPRSGRGDPGWTAGSWIASPFGARNDEKTKRRRGPRSGRHGSRSFITPRSISAISTPDAFAASRGRPAAFPSSRDRAAVVAVIARPRSGREPSSRGRTAVVAIQMFVSPGLLRPLGARNDGKPAGGEDRARGGMAAGRSSRLARYCRHRETAQRVVAVIARPRSGRGRHRETAQRSWLCRHRETAQRSWRSRESHASGLLRAFGCSQ